MTREEHRTAYEAHRDNACKLFKRLEKQTATALTATLLAEAHRLGCEHDTTNAEYHDELAAMSFHYSAAQLLAELGH